MMLKKLLLFLAVFFGHSLDLSAQSCPPNIDFELGNTSFWQYFTGTCCPIVTPAGTAAIFDRHTLTTGSGVDPYGLFPTVAPGGGSYSLRLGNNSAGAEAEKARYYVHVPSGINDYSLIYRYAVVLEDPGSSHSALTKPRFEVNATDSATGDTIPCAQFSYVASAALPGFTLSSVPSGITFGALDVVYKSWTTASINLSGYNGTTITIDFASGDCGLGFHFGYGYLDMTCGLFAISVNVCNDTLAALSAPDGYAAYTWYDSSSFSLLAAGQSVSIPQPAFPTTYAVVLQPYPGFGCNDTLYTKVTPSHLHIDAWGDTAVCYGKNALLQARGTDITIPLTYAWSPGSGLSCTNCLAVLAPVYSTIVYTVTVTNRLGCTKWDTVRASLLSNPPGTITHTDATCHGYNDGQAIVTPPPGLFPYVYIWSTIPVQTDSVADNLVAGTYTVTVVDSDGCMGDGIVTISEPPPTVIHVLSYTNPTTCLGADGTITLEGLIAGQSFVVSYLFNGIPQTATLTANAGGQLLLAGLVAGVYSSITIVGTTCPYNTVGPVTLTDPPLPALPGVGSNSPVCLGAILNLISGCITPGVTYSWSGPGGFSSTMQNPAPIDPARYTDSGLYTVTVTVHNCSSSDTTRVIIKPKPIPVATNSGPVCAGDNVYFASSSATGATYYSWRGPDFFISSVQNPAVYSVGIAATGSYSVTITLNGCSDTASTFLLVNPRPALPIGFDTSYCQFASPVPLRANGVNIYWYPAIGSLPGTAVPPLPSTLSPGVTTWYISQNVAGCVSKRVPVTATVFPTPASSLVLSDSMICLGNYISAKAINSIGPVDDNQGISWYMGFGDSILNVNPVVKSFDTIGVFTISGTIYHSVCPDITVSKKIRVMPYPLFHIGDDTSICPGQPPLVLGDHINSGNPSAIWNWNTGQHTPTISVSWPGILYASVTIDGCTTSDTLVVVNDCYIDIPNVFSPNGDNVNDYFFPRQLLIKGLTSFHMDIFNRWGQLLFTTDSPDGRGWDGHYNGVLQPEGVYVYMIDVSFKNNKKEHRAGNVTLLH